MPAAEGLSYNIRIDDLRKARISSGIPGKNGGFLCELELFSKSDEGNNAHLEDINLSIDGRRFSIPRDMIAADRGVVETTPLFRIDDNHIGFVVKFGEGEYAFGRLFRINLETNRLKYEDRDVAGNLERVSASKELHPPADRAPAARGATRVEAPPAAADVPRKEGKSGKKP